MREFLYNLLMDLDKLTGLKQYERLLAAKDFKKEINDLLDILCRTCDQFGYIPDADKQRIVSANVISDPEFIGLNAKVLFKWFSQTKGFYHKELAHEENKVPADYKPLEGEAREEWLKRWQESLKSFESEKAPIGGGSRLKASLEELPKVEDYHAPPIEYLNTHDLHLRWMKECFDPRTAKPNDNYLPEKDWLQLNT
jgi:hypothetical protein